MRKSLVPVFLCLLLPGLHAQDIKLSPLETLKAEIYRLQDDPDLAHGTWGLCVLDVKKDSVMADYNSNTGFVPASSMKVVTTGAALALLGENFRYETKIQYDGTLDSVNGVVYGNVYIRGSGDPSLASKYFLKDKDSVMLTQKWARQLVAKGIRKIEGSIIADAGVFEQDMVPDTWIWGDMGNYYGAGASGLNFRDNLYSVFYQSGSEGDTARISRIYPPMPGMKMYSTVKAAGTKDNAYLYGAPYSNIRFAQGSIPPKRNDYQVDGSMPDPAYYCAFELDSILRMRGVRISEKPASLRDLKLAHKEVKKHRLLLFSEYSPRLAEIVWWTNKKSVNLYAESLLKTIALRKNGLGTESGGTDAVASFWASKGVDIRGLYMNDGCGLSRWNSITPRQFTEMLRVLTKDPNFKSFYRSLPEHNATVVAKSGYITRVRSYTGYATKKNGELIAFSVIANNYDCLPLDMRKKLEKVLDLIGNLE
ncbi:MAG TPA: D-alanyl-D-alanine carboxypeptidase/D-alanyl-D-alanine-endopeptidase [Bacteroidia bacterium]|jgi:D-alanyl-D-alanine carboxypeptidase/D-alanyl-D-alanine-endopeptidase (penicillin-binding protein 4)|nr:D-alanyl-D-alanine carboxypeptidase/D-alanyl-D-alanine-endopeptidase [Bacteroidia bacterium]